MHDFSTTLSETSDETDINKFLTDSVSSSNASTSSATLSFKGKSPETPQFSAGKAKPKTASTQPTLTQFIERKAKFSSGDKKSKDITQKVARMICIDNQPFSIVEDRGFRELLSHLEPRYTLPSRKHFSQTLIPQMYKQCKDEVENILQEPEHVSVTIDFWTSTSNDDYMSVTVHFVDKHFKPHHICIEVVPFPEISHSAQNICNFLKDTLQTWNLHDKIVAVVRDNGRNIVCALNLANFDHIPCIAHTFQLVVKDGLLNTPSVRNLITNCKRIVGHYKHSSQACKILKSTQEKLKLPNHKLVQDEPTRWNSTLHMMKRLYEQKQAIILSSSEVNLPVELGQSQWDLMKNCISVMNIFDHATFVASSSKVTASEVIPLVNSTKRELSKMTTETSSLRGMKNDLLASLNLRYCDVETTQLYTMATLLDTRLKTSVFTCEENAARAQRELTNAVELVDKNVFSPQSQAQVQEPSHGKGHVMWTFYTTIMKDQKSCGSADISATAEVEGYLKEALCPADTDIFQFWNDKVNFPRLRALARKFLSVPPATVHSERLFSTAGLVVDRKRSRLDPDKVKMLVFLNKNLK